MVTFQEIYEQFGRPVYRFLLSLTGSREEAEELLQETFYQAFLHIDRFEGRCSVYTWLCQIGKTPGSGSANAEAAMTAWVWRG